jgi:hypothetical protein
MNGPWVVPEPGCKGFAWIGQAVTGCDSCGAPIWEHDLWEEIDREAGPFVSPAQFVYKPISQKTKDYWRAFYNDPDCAYQGKQ